MATISTPEPDILALAGELDMHESPALKRAFEPFLARKAPRVLADFSGVTYIDSSGLAVFIDAMQRIQEYGGKFALCGLGENVRAVFELSRLDQVFRIFPDRKAALGAL
jgi:anti-sigma B factor antagonist